MSLVLPPARALAGPAPDVILAAAGLERHWTSGGCRADGGIDSGVQAWPATEPTLASRTTMEAPPGSVLSTVYGPGELYVCGETAPLVTGADCRLIGRLLGNGVGRILFAQWPSSVVVVELEDVAIDVVPAQPGFDPNDQTHAGVLTGRYRTLVDGEETGSGTIVGAHVQFFGDPCWISQFWFALGIAA